MIIDIVYINPEGDGVTAVYIDGDLHTYGDYYHDKIDDWVRGFIDGLRYASVRFTKRGWELCGDRPLAKAICEDADVPPGLFSEYQGNILVPA
jgi:hypothetical protein